MGSILNEGGVSFIFFMKKCETVVTENRKKFALVTKGRVGPLFVSSNH